MSGFDHLKATFFDECAELLEVAYAQLAAIEQGRADDDTINAIFRAFHSIKGGGGAFGFDRLVGFAHELETVLALLRDRRLEAVPILTLLVRSTDALSDLVAGARSGSDLPAGLEAELLEQLRDAAVCGDRRGPRSGTAADRKVAVVAPPAPRQRYRIRFAPHPDLFRSANDPLLVIRQLMRLGDVQAQADVSRLPELAAMDAELSYLSWTLTLDTAADLPAVREVFEFVEDDCDLTIDTVAQNTPATLAPAHKSDPAVARAMQPAAAAAEAAKPAAANAVPPSIRVDVEKVDRLVNLVGELVINQAMLAQVASGLPPDLCAPLLGGLETMSQHLRELQEGVMAIRAQPVKSVFSRMPRLVREVSAQLGKDVRLVLSGEATEIDKTVIEQLADPLTHLLRNALDHGIEMPEERLAAGKLRQGTVTLTAEHRGGRIVIEVADDGRGISRPKVLAKARDRGLVPPDTTLSDEEIDQLIFLPGFSTADALSDISGRGVGMDVVKRNIHALGGRITVESRHTAGSRFALSLPLTLAIMDGMAVAVGPETYIVPLTNIMESLRPKKDTIHFVVGHGDVMAIRGAYVPLLYLHERFSVAGATGDASAGIVVIVESDGGNRIGLVVDELLGQQQVVVKSLEANYGAVDGIGGATVLGDGRVALILDVSQLRQSPAFARLRAA